ncbi:hypothetical protein, partial [Anaerorhabdus sp.]|uniref:hypothetical protein n=1 Tax=Anaerorhabdus sp. TaxID=1872524 RepID=UPI002FC99C6E
ILFGKTDSGLGVYRVVKKDKTVLTLFYSENSVITDGLAYDQNSNSYDQSDLASWLNNSFKNTYLSEIERASLINEKITLPTNEQIVDNGDWKYTDVAREGKGTWWLSSSGSSEPEAKAVNNDGSIIDLGITNNYGVRPVIELNLASILYITPTDIGKQSNGVGENALKMIPELTDEAATTTNYKLTLIDSSKQFKIKEANTSMSVGALETITVNYTGVDVTKDTYISAMISNNKGEDIYYGNLMAANQESGELKIKIPSGLDGNYVLKVFTETINDEGATDSASKFESIPLKIANLLKGDVTLEGKYQYGEVIKASVSDSNAFGDFTYTWYLDNVKIEDYDDATYTPVKKDIGKNIKCEVTDKGDGTNKRNEKITSAVKEIGKKDLIVKVKDKSIYLGSPLPDINIEYIGYVGTDFEDLNSESSPFFKTEASYVYPESITAESEGLFKLEILNENIGELNQDPAKYYNLIKEFGYLKITAKPNYVVGSYWEEYVEETTKVNTQRNRIKTSEDHPVENSQTVFYGKGKVSIIFEENSEQNLSLPSLYNLLNSVLTSEQLDQVFKGASLAIRITAKEKEIELTPEEQEIINNSNIDGNTLKTEKIFDISIEVSFNNEEWIQITEFNDELLLMLKIDESLLDLTNKWYLIHLHEGESMILRDIDDDPLTITVKTNKNSIYALAYEDGGKISEIESDQVTKPEITESSCKVCHMCSTPFGICLFVLSGGAVLILLGVLFVIMKTKSKE